METNNKAVKQISRRPKFARPVAEPEPVDEFREILAARRGERSSFGRMSHRVLLTGAGARPSKRLFAELVRQGCAHYLPLYAATWRAYSDETLDLDSMMPPPPAEPKKPGPVAKEKPPKPVKLRVEKPPKPIRPAFTYRGIDEAFHGVALTPSGKYKARGTTRTVENKIAYVSLGIFAVAEDAARAADTFIRSRGHGFLNFNEPNESELAA